MGALLLPDPLLRAEERLDVVPELMGDHIRLREVARRVEPVPQLSEEPQVQVHLRDEDPADATTDRDGDSGPATQGRPLAPSVLDLLAPAPPPPAHPHSIPRTACRVTVARPGRRAVGYPTRVCSARREGNPV